MRKQMVRYTAAGIVGVILAIALTIMANWFAARHWVRADWTTSRLYSLSEKTGNIITELEEEVRVVVFMTPASTLYDQVFELLERYKSISDKISVEYIDPDREPLKTRQLAEQFGISVADTVVFAVGERTKYVTSDQMAEYDYSGMQYGQAPEMRAFKGEEQFTSAILSLVAPDVPKVYFVTGHGEASIAAGSGALSDRSLAVLGEALKRENIEAEDTALLGGSVPEDADVLAIVGPTRAFTDNEIQVLSSFVASGGRVLICLDPLIEPSGVMRPTRLESFLEERGITVGDDLVVDPSRKLPFYDLSAVYLTDFPSHPVTQGLEGFAVLFTIARSVTPDEGGDGQSIVETSSEGWGETNLAQLLAGQPVALDEIDTAGPVSVAVALEGQAEATEAEVDTDEEQAEPQDYRLLVFGDSEFMTDFEISNAGNQILAMNAFNWLAAREQVLGIPPRDVEQASLFLSGEQMRTILLMTLIVMPGAAILAGVLIWRRRRH
jgi:ABC-type uncharacterized transport system involved in gliding motility auxiliary subunit